MAFPLKEEEEEVDSGTGTPVRYLPLRHVYSTSAPCVSASGSSNVVTKKVKARRMIADGFDGDSDGGDQKPYPTKPPVVHVYARRRKRPRNLTAERPESGALVAVKEERCESDGCEGVGGGDRGVGVLGKKRRSANLEVKNLGDNSRGVGSSVRRRLREARKDSTVDLPHRRKRKSSENLTKVDSNSACIKRWLWLNFDDVDPEKFIGLQCKVYWPLDGEWYRGCIIGYDLEANRHQVKYNDGDKEELILSSEKIKFYVSREDMQHLNLSLSVRSLDSDDIDYDEMVVLAASWNDCQDHEPGDIIWAKLTGHAMWPAIVVDESIIHNRKGLNKISKEKSLPVQFFGSHDFARVKTKQVTPFLKGLLSSFHLKCTKPHFHQSLVESKAYLSEQKLSKRMLRMQKLTEDDDCESMSGEDEKRTDSGDDCIGDERVKRKLDDLIKFPFEIGDLQVIRLGKIVKDSDRFQVEGFICPEGYTAMRKFTSITDPSLCALYKMEVLRDAESKIQPLFRVTLDNGEQFQGSTPSSCWNKIFRRIRKMQNSASDGSSAEGGSEKLNESGFDMFGFSNPEIFRLVQELSTSKISSKFSMSKSISRRYQDLSSGYRPVRVDWKDLDKCSVCHMDEEYENNLFLQCDKCRMMVHARCYGELEPVDGVLWLCKLCGPGAPDSPPPCCLCPVTGGAMKPTTDGRWAHLACAIWIPETCLSDIKTMEPIDGLSRINKDRWKLLCSICGVSYGACIQCSNSTCRVAYHPLCARAAGLCVELEDEDRLHLISVEDDEDDQCIRLLSFCKKHRQPSNERTAFDERIGQVARQCSDYNPPSNPSGCARTEPYNHFGRRGRKEPEALAAASLKRLFVDNRPYLVGGYCQHESLGNPLSSSALSGSKFSFRNQKIKASQLDAPKSILSMVEKYNYMRETFRKRLAFGKSGIHGFGIFAKQPHRAGDMVIEYTGELVRPSIADRRERLIYNSLVGAGTYMFRIDDERVIDATRAGSIAHLINHSCEPNCYSRVISFNGDDHIIIFAKRDIKRWEELTYDYRFFSIDEQLACYCGFPRCRGVVNDIDAEERMAKRYAPRSELIGWIGE